MSTPSDTDSHASNEWYKSAFDRIVPRHLCPSFGSRRGARSPIRSTGPADHARTIRPGPVLRRCRHLSHLSAYCDHLVGLDYSPAMLRLARGRAERAALVRADMRNIPFQRVDVVLNFFTSFGYFDSRDDNLQVVRGVSKALTGDGGFLIDYINPICVECALAPQSLRTVDDYEIHERRWITETPWRVHKTTQVFKEGRLLDESHESVQLYTPDEFVRLLRDGGLHVDRLLGNFSDAPMDDSQPRMVAIGHRT